MIERTLTNPMYAAAVEVARNGLPVYSARPRGKAPLYKGWQRAATTKIEHLDKFWGTHPKANVGVACRGLVVVDADSARGEDAVAELQLPATTTVTTRRGSHLYFAGNAPTVANVLPDVEIRGKGSGVLGAGSVHPSGFEYVWEIPPWEVEPVPLPPELRQLIEQKRMGHEAVDGFVYPGGRSTYLLRVAGSLRGRYGVGDIARPLHAVNETQCRPPLEPEKVDKLARDAAKWSTPPPWVVDPAGFCTADPRLSSTARFVLRLLCDHANAEGWCNPGLRRLRQLSGLGMRHLRGALDELEDHGRTKIKRSRGGNRANEYTLLQYSPPTSSGSSSSTSRPGGYTGRSSVTQHTGTDQARTASYTTERGRS